MQHSDCLQIRRDEFSFVPQDSTSSGANVKRLEAESASTVKAIEKSIASKKKEVSR